MNQTLLAIFALAILFGVYNGLSLSSSASGSSKNIIDFLLNGE